MKKFYVVAPLAALVVFSGVYWKHHRAYEARIARVHAEQQTEKQRKHAEEAAARSAAQHAAAAALEQRKLERAEKERQETAQKDARHAAEQRRNAAFENEKRLRAKLDRLNAELQLEEVLLARSEEKKRELAHEQRFLVEHVRAVEANRAASYQILQKLEAAERAEPPAANAQSANRSKNG